LTLSSFRRSCLIALAIGALICLCGCAVPLAPGYSIQKQTITVQFVPGSRPHLAVRAEYHLANVGNAPLDSIEVGLPGHKSFGRENLRVQINGRDVASAIARDEDADEGESSSSDAWPVVWHIPFSPAWPRKQKRNLLITYDLTAASEPRARMYLSPTVFYLNDSGWFPDLLAPKSFLAKDLVRPDPSELDIIVPQNFLAHGSGGLRGVKKSSAETEYRFRIRKDDFDPFVIAGQYHEQRVTTSDGSVDFWMLGSSPASDPQEEGKRVSAAQKFYENTFGLLPKSVKTITLVDFRIDWKENMDSSAAEAAILPGVVLTPVSVPLPGDLGTAPILEEPSLDLARTWFQKLIIPQNGAWSLADALSAYSFSSASHGSLKQSEWEEAVGDLLHLYDLRASKAVEKPIASLAATDPPAQIRIGDIKAELFVFAIEDHCGTDNLNHAVAHMVSALHFQQYGYDDFRSAVEEECHQDLGPFFRSWLNDKGIPADFRAKYEAASQGKH
jgi:hypothetical protein